jgi:hypothetical protein
MLEPFSLEQLVQEFASLPGIGKKTARRLAYHLLQKPKQDIERFADRLYDNPDAQYLTIIASPHTGEVEVHEGIEFFDSYQREHKGDEE